VFDLCSSVGERVKGRTLFKWATGLIAIVVFIGVGAVVLLFVVGFMSLEKGEKHRRQFQAELESGRWDFGDQPTLFAVAQGIVKNDQRRFARRQRALRRGEQRKKSASRSM